MKRRIGFLKGKSIVIGDTNIVTKNEIHISKLAEEISNYGNLNYYGSKVRIGMLEGKPIVAGDKNLVTQNEIHVTDIKSEGEEVVPESRKEITFNAWVIVGGGNLGGGEEDVLEHENQTFTALDGMTWKEYIDSEYGWDSPFFYYEGMGVHVDNGNTWFPEEYGILLNGILVSENDKIIANAQYDNGGRISG